MTNELSSGNLFDRLPGDLAEESFAELVAGQGFRLERIVSQGQATPAGQWFDQDSAEWVMLLAGSAALLFEGEPAPRVMRSGDYVLIPAHCRHRVEWTLPAENTVWLALHFEPELHFEPGLQSKKVEGRTD